MLYYIFILHQTTTMIGAYLFMSGCIISSFYIKPQLNFDHSVEGLVVLYLHSTSNHNLHNARIALG